MSLRTRLKNLGVLELEETNKMKICTEFELDKTPSSLSKMLKLLSLNHVDGKTLTPRQSQLMRDKLNEYFNEVIEPIKTFDGIVFQKEKKVIEFCGSAYIQAIVENNDNGWIWESINLDHYFLFSDIGEKGIIPVIQDLLKRQLPRVWIAYYYFCLKHSIPLKFGYGYETQDILEKKLEERIRSDIEALANTYFSEGFQDDYLRDKYDQRIHKEEYLYELLDESREKYEDSSEQSEDLENATNEIIGKWQTYTDDKITQKILDKIKEDLE